MTVANKLRNMLSTTKNDEKNSEKDLVRAQLERDADLRDISLGNISSENIDDRIEPHFESVSSEVHKNLVNAEEKLSNIFSDDERDFAKEPKLSRDFEHDTSTSWTDAITLELSDDEDETEE